MNGDIDLAALISAFGVMMSGLAALIAALAHRKIRRTEEIAAYHRDRDHDDHLEMARALGRLAEQVNGKNGSVS